MGNIATSNLGNTGVALTNLGFGGAPLGDLFEILSETQAQSTLQAAWDAGLRYFDTAPFYGYGKSEHRFGHFLRQQPRNEFVLSTKIGRVLRATRDPDNFDKGMWAGDCLSISILTIVTMGLCALLKTVSSGSV